MKPVPSRLASTTTVAVAVALLATGCSEPLSEEGAFELWGDDMRAELTTTPGSPAVDAMDGAPLNFVLDEPGLYSVGAACRDAESTVLQVSSDWQVVADIEVTCGESAVVDVELPSPTVYITATDDADWYVVLNR